MLWCTNVYAQLIELKKCFLNQAYGYGNFENKERAKEQNKIADNWDNWEFRYQFVGNINKCKVVDYYENNKISDNCKAQIKKDRINQADFNPGDWKSINTYDNHIFSIDPSDSIITRFLITNDEMIKYQSRWIEWHVAKTIEENKKRNIKNINKRTIELRK